MAKFAHSDVLDNGINHIKNNAIRMILIKNYAFGDSYATVVANALATAVMAPGDYIVSSSGNNRLVTSGTKTETAAASSVGGDNLHIAHTDGVSKVLWVTDETSDQVITSGNPVDFPASSYTSNQPT